MDKANTGYTYKTGEPIFMGDNVELSIVMETDDEWLEERKYKCIIDKKDGEWALIRGNYWWCLKDVVNKIKKIE
ncbi:hypothetical protein [Methanobrevibacter sp. UBA417]|jgi:hypothetical protein|uniref:hypothetical protein n=1 Tax=Methanobrevibacter sp. UBA417 TaxID=1915487 RepID=UPI0039B9C263